MPRNLRDLRRKIKGIGATRQVTKAMELVSASKMRKAIHNTVQLRRYSFTAWSILRRAATQHSIDHPALTKRPMKHVLIILFTSDRGLAGNLNAQVTRGVNACVRKLEEAPGFE